MCAHASCMCMHTCTMHMHTVGMCMQYPMYAHLYSFPETPNSLLPSLCIIKLLPLCFVLSL